MLRECLLSILAQTFADFEVIVGNDYTACPVSLAELGIVDARVRVIDHVENLGERGNLNSLLMLSRGEYFTWQADDDFYDPRYLEAVAAALAVAPRSSAVFTSYRVVRGEAGPEAVPPVQSLPRPTAMTGSAFLRGYWDGSVKVMGLVGMYRRDYLVGRGGVAGLAAGPIAVMSEYDLLTRCGLLDEVSYVDVPLVAYRAHAASWSTSTETADATRTAGLALLRRSLAIFGEPMLAEDFDVHASGLVRVVLGYVLKTLARERNGTGVLRAAAAYTRQLQATAWELLEHRPTSARHVTRVMWLRFAILLPQLIFIRQAPRGLRTTAVRLRGLITGEVLSRSPSPTL